MHKVRLYTAVRVGFHSKLNCLFAKAFSLQNFLQEQLLLDISSDVLLPAAYNGLQWLFQLKGLSAFEPTENKFLQLCYFKQRMFQNSRKPEF